MSNFNLGFAVLGRTGETLELVARVRESDPPLEADLSTLELWISDPKRKVEVDGSNGASVKEHKLKHTIVSLPSQPEFTDEDELHHETARVWEVRWTVPAQGQAVYLAMQLRLKNAIKAHTSKQVAVPEEHYNHATAKQVTVQTGPFPRLSVALERARVETKPIASQEDYVFFRDAAIQACASVFTVRLRMGLELAWREVEGPLRLSAIRSRLQQHQDDAAFAGFESREDAEIWAANERWARRVSELLVGTVYLGSGLTYFGWGTRKVRQPDGSTKWLDADYEIFRRIAKGGVDPVSPLCLACQHLANFGVLSRGYEIEEENDRTFSLNAGTAAAATFTQRLSPRGTWMFTDPSAPKVITKSMSLADRIDALSPEVGQTPAASELMRFEANGAAFGPGSVAVFACKKASPPGFTVQGKVALETKNGQTIRWAMGTATHLADNTSGAHIGFVLRTRGRSPDVMQALDTGGFGAPNRQAGTFIPHGGAHRSGNMDEPAVTHFTGSAPYRGVGILPKMSSADAAELETHVQDVLDEARPLGFVRLILTRRTVELGAKNMRRLSEWLVYASPTLRMWGPGQKDNYAIARFVWALRGMPGGDHIRPILSVCVPQKELAEVTLAPGARGKTVEQLASDALATLESSDDPRRRVVARLAMQGVDRAVAAARIFRSYTLPILDLTTGADGRVRSTFQISETKLFGRLSFHHYLTPERDYLRQDLLPVFRSVVPGFESNDPGVRAAAVDRANGLTAALESLLGHLGAPPA